MKRNVGNVGNARNARNAKKRNSEKENEDVGNRNVGNRNVAEKMNGRHDNGRKVSGQRDAHARLPKEQEGLLSPKKGDLEVCVVRRLDRSGPTELARRGGEGTHFVVRQIPTHGRTVFANIEDDRISFEKSIKIQGKL